MVQWRRGFEYEPIEVNEASQDSELYTSLETKSLQRGAGEGKEGGGGRRGGEQGKGRRGEGKEGERGEGGKWGRERKEGGRGEGDVVDC